MTSRVLAQVAMHRPVVRELVRKRTDTIEGGSFVMRTWNDLLGVFPGLIGVKTGHTDDAGWCEVAAARRSGFTIYAVILGSPTRAQRNFDLQRLLAWGVSQYRTLDARRTRSRTPGRRRRTAGAPSRSWPARRSCAPCASAGRSSSGSSRRPPFPSP